MKSGNRLSAWRKRPVVVRLLKPNDISGWSVCLVRANPRVQCPASDRGPRTEHGKDLPSCQDLYLAIAGPVSRRCVSAFLIQTLPIPFPGTSDMPKPRPSAGGATAGSPARLNPQVRSQQPPSAPSWPPFKPVLPVTDLALVPHESSPSKVILVRNFWPRSLCRDYVAFLKGLPLVTTPGRPRRGEAVRVNDRFQIDDAAFANRLWTDTGLREALTSDDCPEELRALWYVQFRGRYWDRSLLCPALARAPNCSHVQRLTCSL
jgi:hypothetical protein